jgi:hypothetical protein
MMFPRLRILLAQQTTPDEVVLFLLLAILAALVVAFILYAVLLGGFWRWRLRGITSIRTLLFPDLGQLRAYAPEYALAAITAVLLSLTIVERNDVVRTIHAFQIDQLPAPATEAIRTALPFRSLQDADVQEEGSEGTAAEGAEAGEGDPITRAVVAVLSGAVAPPAALAEVGVAALLRPMLAAGEAGRSLAAVQAIAEQVAPSTWSRVVNRRSLLTVALLLLTLYAGWLAWSRGRAVERDPAAGISYRHLAGRLAVPALCIALLLSSAVRVGDPDRYARSALATASMVELGDAGMAVERGLHSAMSRQTADMSMLRVLVVGSDEVPSVADLGGRIDSASRQVRAFDNALGELGHQVSRDRAANDSIHMALQGRLDAVGAVAGEASSQAARAERRALELEERVESIRAELDRFEQAVRRNVGATENLGRRLERAEAGLAELAEAVRSLGARQRASTGILFVAAHPGDPYVIRPQRPNANPITGVWTGAHAVPTGNYAVTARGRTERVHVAAGGATTVRFPLPEIP